MSALAPAPRMLTAPVRRPHGTRREWPLSLLPPAPEPTSRNGLPIRVLETWGSALDACASAFDAVEGMKVYADAELRRHRQRLHEERRWLGDLRAVGRYAALPTLAHVRKSPNPGSVFAPMFLVGPEVTVQIASAPD